MCGGWGECKNCEGRERQRRIKLDNIDLITSTMAFGLVPVLQLKWLLTYFVLKKEYTY